MKQLVRKAFAPFRKMLLVALSAVLGGHNGHGKRILFLTTLFMQLAKLPAFQRETMAMFNQSLKLARTEDALEIPSKVHRLIWDEENLDQTIREACGGDIFCSTLNPEDASKACGKIVDSTPQWLRYGRREEMVTDLMRLVASSREIPRHHSA